MTNPFKRRPKFPTPSKDVIIPAFEVGGNQYFQFQDPFNAAYMRAMGAIKFYDDLSRRCTSEYLQLHYEAVKNLLTKPSKGVLDLTELYKLNEQLGERMKFIVVEEYLWNFASVIFFDGNESPYDYDMGYCNKKIAFWKKHLGTKDFFLQLPLINLIPSLEGLKDFNWEQYEQVVKKITSFHLERLSANTQYSEKKNNLLRSFGLPEEMPQKSQSSGKSL